MLETGEFELGHIVAFVNYASQILLAMIVVSNLIGIFTRAAASASRVREVLNTNNELVHGDVIPEGSDTVIEFDNVSFSYNKNADTVLKDISFTVSRGEKVGIIGGTGSGKSTLAALMMYEYAADSGCVKIMGQDVKALKDGYLRDVISVVPQKAALITGTIAYNIRMGKPLTDEEIKRACQIAQIADHIENMPQKYDSEVLRDGKNFSGGQRQRLCIARAVAKKSEILILDDSASALDFATEKNLRNAIRDSLDGICVITISQRVSSIRHCDKIIVLEDGEISDIGTHEELLARCAAYGDICRHQLLSDETEVAKNE